MRSTTTPPGSKELELETARELADAFGWNATSYQILNPGIERWFSRAGDAVVGHVTAHGYRVVAGSPICDAERLEAVVEEFERDTRVKGLKSCYFAADHRLAEKLARRGPLDRILLGAQPVWHPAHWNRVVACKASLRAQLHRARNKGVIVDHWPVETATGHPELARCLHEWLETRGLPPLHFLVEPETLGRLNGRAVFVARRDRAVVGFLVASPIPQRNGWLIEQTIRGRGAVNGTCELLLDAACRHLAERGAEMITLGLSPLSKRADLDPPRQHLWLRALLAWVRAHGRRFYDFDGLDAYKAKFQPERWEPIYAITGEQRIGLGTLYAIAGAFARSPPPVLVARALLRALRQELSWLRARSRTCAGPKPTASRAGGPDPPSG